MDEQQLPLLEDGKEAVDKAVVTSSYELAINSLARLAAYGEAGEFYGTDNEVAVRQTQLAADDLLHLSISLRRLISATGLHNTSKNISIPSIRFVRHDKNQVSTRINGSYDVWSLVNKIVHSAELEIFGFAGHVLRSDLDFLEVYQMALERRRYSFPPVCYAKTENGQIVLFHVIALCEAAERMASLASDKAARESIFLGSFYRD